MSTRQGWNPDPFGRFEDRYFSDGAPTTLVRTGSIETRDEPGAGTEDRLPEAPNDSKRSGIELRPHLYERRDRRRLASTLLAAAIVFPFAVWELLATTTADRMFGVVAVVITASMLAVVVRVFRVPRSDEHRHRPLGNPTHAP
jgi:hypothetical protein